MISINSVKVGDYILFQNDPYEVIFSQHSKTGRAGAVLRTKLKNLITSAIINHTFQGSDEIVLAQLETRKAQYLYKNGDFFVFMDNENYEQFDLLDKNIGQKGHFLVEGCEIEVVYYENKAINIKLPIKMDFKVIEAPPAIKGNTASGGTKQVKIETGTKINTPLFIEEGDVVRVNTEKGQYCERVK